MKWEYRVITIASENYKESTKQLEARLNELGSDGWEAVNVTVVGHEGYPNFLYVCVKRPFCPKCQADETAG